jgi:phosphoenolpyruvate carboxykinase (ATP)
VGRRFSIPDTRAVIAAVQSGALTSVPTEHLPGINLRIPRSVPGVSSAVLNPRTTWTDPLQYDRKAAELIDQFQRNFIKFKVPEAIVAAGPQGYGAEGAA